MGILHTLKSLPCAPALAVMAATAALGGCADAQSSAAKSPAVAASNAEDNANDPRLWISDLQNGEYRNPILHIDYSDPDVVAVNGHYYMTASSFNAAPGLPVLHSTDLVNWELINYALPQQVPLDVFATPQHGNGVWAPNIRYHDGKFWIFYPDPDFGIYVTTAADPAGKWSEPELILAGKGLIDPTPLWDDDGKAWLLHGWAKSRAGFNNVLSLREMSGDASQVSDTYTHVVDGNAIDGYRTLEGPKFYKRNGYYYIFAPAGGVETGWQSVFRSDNIAGPYTPRTVMDQGDTLINGPHQGSWIHTNKNEDWFIHFQSRKAYGRIVHLQPMHWENDWPVIGEDKDGDGTGEPVYRWKKPLTDIPGEVKPQPATDEFNDELGIQWQWNANWQPDWYSIDKQSGVLTLPAQPKITTTGDNLWSTPSLLLQKLPALTYDVRAEIILQEDGAQAEGGLLLFGEDYAWIGVKPVDGETHLVYVQCKNARTGCDESVHDYGPVNALFSENGTADDNATTRTIELRYVMAGDATAIFSYRVTADTAGSGAQSANATRFTVVGEQFKARRGRWVGAKTGLFSVSADADAAMPGAKLSDAKPSDSKQHAPASLKVNYFRFLPRRRP